MPSFRHTAVSQAPPEEVWKLLYDPNRFPEWWAGIAAVQARGPGGFAYFAEGEPDVPVPQAIQTSAEERRIVVSCLVHDLRFEWRLEPVGGGESTRIDVLVDIPEAEAASFDALREGIGGSIARLAELAAASR